jgi:hypothetical protein
MPGSSPEGTQLRTRQSGASLRSYHRRQCPTRNYGGFYRQKPRGKTELNSDSEVKSPVLDSLGKIVNRKPQSGKEQTCASSSPRRTQRNTESCTGYGFPLVTVDDLVVRLRHPKGVTGLHWFQPLFVLFASGAGCSRLRFVIIGVGGTLGHRQGIFLERIQHQLHRLFQLRIASLGPILRG